MGKQWKTTSFDHHRSNKKERKGNRVPSKNDLKSEKKMVKVPKYTEIIKLIYPSDPSFHGFPWKKISIHLPCPCLELLVLMGTVGHQAPKAPVECLMLLLLRTINHWLGKKGHVTVESYFSQPPSSSRVRVSLKKTGVASD